MSIALHHRTDEEDGFTLIELMVVVLIIGILLAIAIPTFLGARTSADNRSAQSNLRNALTTEKVLFTDNQTYADTSVAADLTSLQQSEPSLNWISPGPAVNSRDVVATVNNKSTVVLEAVSQTGECWFIADISAPGTPSGTFYGSNSKANGGCPATLPPAPTTAPAQGSQSTGTTPTGAAGWGLSFGK